MFTKTIIQMKKLLTIALLLLAGLTAGAQGRWTVSHREADPMKGQDARDAQQILQSDHAYRKAFQF